MDNIIDKNKHKHTETKTENKLSETDLLLNQRQVLVDNIKEINSNIFKVVVAIISGLISMMISYADL